MDDMDKKITDNRLILKNTIYLYIRQALILVVGLYSSRVVLQVLGSTDYGIYNVAGGVSAMMGFLSSSMASVCQRYYAFDIAKGDREHLNIVFNTSIFVYAVIAFVIIVVSETAGLWWLNNKLVIPDDRMNAARFVYHFSVLSFVVNVMGTSYRALITAYEKMSIYAAVSIFECMAKLMMVFLLQFCSFDKLFLYGFLMFALQAAIMGIYVVICSRIFSAAKLRRHKDILLMKEMGRFISWNMVGNISGTFYNQGGTILINMFFGPLVNTARSISSQVNAAVITFAGHFTSAMQPQITKNYAVGNYKDSYSQLYRGAKLSFFLMYIFTVPLCMKMRAVLTIWLGSYPDFTEEFTKLVLINTCLDVTYNLFDILAQATGKIKGYQWMIAVIQTMNLPMSFLFFKFGFKPYSISVIGMILCVVSMIARLMMLRTIARMFHAREFIKRVILPVFLLTVVSLVMIVAVNSVIQPPDTIIGIVETTAVSVLCICFVSYVVLLDMTEKNVIRNMIKVRVNQWIKK